MLCGVQADDGAWGVAGGALRQPSTVPVHTSPRAPLAMGMHKAARWSENMRGRGYSGGVDGGACWWRPARWQTPERADVCHWKQQDTSSQDMRQGECEHAWASAMLPQCHQRGNNSSKTCQPGTQGLVGPPWGWHDSSRPPRGSHGQPCNHRWLTTCPQH